MNNIKVYDSSEIKKKISLIDVYSEINKCQTIIIKNYFTKQEIKLSKQEIEYFVENNKIINLDGLINDNVAENIVSGSLPNFLVENNINYLIDYEYMFTNKTMRMRVGYEDERMSRKIV